MRFIERIPRFGGINRSHWQADGLLGLWAALPGFAGGTKLRNLAGNVHGTLTNGAKWRNDAVHFDGTDDFVLLDSGITTATDFTACAFVIQEVSSTDIIFGDNQGSSKYHLLIDSSNFYISAGAASAAHGGFTSNLWYHVAVTRTGSAVTFYKNGISLGGGTYSTSLTLNSIGAYSSAAFALQGRVRDARLYNRGMTAQQMREIYINPQDVFKRVAAPMGQPDAGGVTGNPWNYYAQAC